MSRFFAAALLLVPAVATAAPPAVTAVAYSPKGEAVAFGVGNDVRLVGTKGEVGRSIPVSGRVTALAFDPRGRALAVAHGETGKSGLVTIDSLGDGPMVVAAAHKDAIYALAFSPDGKTFATAGYDRVIHLWDVLDNGLLGKAPDSR